MFALCVAYRGRFGRKVPSGFLRTQTVGAWPPPAGPCRALLPWLLAPWRTGPARTLGRDRLRCVRRSQTDRARLGRRLRPCAPPRLFGVMGRRPDRGVPTARRRRLRLSWAGPHSQICAILLRLAAL